MSSSFAVKVLRDVPALRFISLICEHAEELTRGTPNDITKKETFLEGRGIYIQSITENPCLLADIFDQMEQELKDSKG